MNSIFSKIILPLGVLAIVGGAVVVGVLLSKQTETPIDLRGNDISGTDHTEGNSQATIELIEYGDFQCPACAAMEPIIQKLMQENGGWIRFAFRHLPLKEIHRNAVNGAHAAEAAHNQGKFWEMKSLLYANQTEWSSLPDPASKFMAYAAALDLDEDRFAADMNSQEVRSRVESDYQTAQSLGLNSTPSFFINGEKIATPPTYEKFLELLQSKRAQ
jgi:protein-disulfide isomerase